MAERPSDIILPEGWTWDLVEQHRARWGIGEDMIPETGRNLGLPCVAWGTIGWHRRKRDYVPAGDLMCDPYGTRPCRLLWEADFYFSHDDMQCRLLGSAEPKP